MQSETENDDDHLEAPPSAMNVHEEIIDVHTDNNIIKSTNTGNLVDKPTYEIISVENQYKNIDNSKNIENIPIKSEKHTKEENITLNHPTNESEQQNPINENKEFRNNTLLTSEEDNYKDILYFIISSINIKF